MYPMNTWRYLTYRINIKLKARTSFIGNKTPQLYLFYIQYDTCMLFFSKVITTNTFDACFQLKYEEKTGHINHTTMHYVIQ